MKYATNEAHASPIRPNSCKRIISNKTCETIPMIATKILIRCFPTEDKALAITPRRPLLNNEAISKILITGTTVRYLSPYMIDTIEFAK